MIIKSTSFFSPPIFLPNLLLLLWGKIINDIESLPNFLRTLSLNKTGNLSTTKIQ